MNKKVMLTAVAITVLGASTFAVTHTYAAESTNTQNPMSSLVTKIAEKFGLKTADVQAVFDEQRQAHMAQKEANYESRLSTLVSEGKITAEQKTLILNKHKELEAARQTNMQNMQSMTGDQRKAAMQKTRTDLEEWAKSNNIDMRYLMPERGMHGHGGFGMQGPPMAGQADISVNPSTTQ